MSKKYYTLEEALEYSRLPEGTFRKYRSAIGGSKIGRRWLFSEDELDRFIEKKRSKPLSELQNVS